MRAKLFSKTAAVLLAALCLAPVSDAMQIKTMAESEPGNSLNIGMVNGSFSNVRPTESVRNLGGRTCILATAWPEMYDGIGNTPDDKLGAQAVRSIQKDYHCIIKIKKLDTTGRNIVLSRAAGVMYANVLDCEAGSSRDFIDIVGANLLNVKSVGLKTRGWNHVQSLAASLNDEAECYGAGTRNDWANRDILFYNRNLAQKYNLGNFYNMVSSGQWTESLFLQICQAFKKVCIGQYEPCAAAGPSRLFDLIYPNRTSPLTYNGRYLFNGADHSVTDVLSFLRTFVSDGLYDKTCDTADFKADGTFEDSADDVARTVADFEAGKTLFFIGPDSLLPGISKDCKAVYGLLPLPKGANADGYTSVVTDCRYFALLSFDPYLENSGALLTALASRTSLRTGQITLRDQTLVKDANSISMLTNSYRYPQILDMTLCRSGNLPAVFNGAAVNAVISQTEFPQQAMDGISAKAQAEIDKACRQ